MKMWICRSEIGDLFLFSSKPSYDECGMEWFKEYYLPDDIMIDFGYRINSKLYPEVTFENSPMEVELVIKK